MPDSRRSEKTTEAPAPVQGSGKVAIINLRKSVAQLASYRPHEDDQRTPAEKTGKPREMQCDVIRLGPGISIRDSDRVASCVAQELPDDLVVMPLEQFLSAHPATLKNWLEITASTKTLERIADMSEKLHDMAHDAIRKVRAAREEREIA